MRQILAILALCLAVPGGTVAAAGCGGLPVEIEGGSDRDHVLVCEGVRRATVFLGALGLKPAPVVRVRLHDVALPAAGSHIGRYDAAAHRIDLVTYPRCEVQCAVRPPFGSPVDEALYISFVSHEMTHAVIGGQLTTRELSPLAHEYIAYVVQLSTMDADARARVLQRYDVAAYAGPAEMSLTYYALDPCAFGVKAYLHYRSLTEPGAFARGLLSGDIRLGPRAGNG